MARYLVLKPTYLHAKGQTGIALHKAGSIVDVADDFGPGTSLAALDLPARQAKERVRPERVKRNANSQPEVTERRLRVALPRNLARMLADAEAEMDRAEARQKASA